jgi:hypothetical protein
MKQEGSLRPPDAKASSPEMDRAVATMLVSVDRLDELGLDGIEPATTFGWPAGEVAWPATPISTS